MLQQSEVTDGLVKSAHKEVYQQQTNMKEKPLSDKHFRENTELKQETHGSSSVKLLTTIHGLVTQIF